jgi:hypothetical protein
MALPPTLLQSTCDVYRPFGAGAPTHTAISCRLAADFAAGRLAAGNIPEWTHYVDLDVSADVLDGCTRSAGAYTITYADGDELRISVGGVTQRFVVVWVEVLDAGTSREFKRAYLLRHSA